jgi:hypothetical protein
MTPVNCPVLKDAEDSIIAQRAYDDLNNAFKYSRSSTSSIDAVASTQTNYPLGVNYLYLSTIRGGSYKKSMENTENFCNTCMKGGCFTCSKGKTKISAEYNIIVINLPKLYKKYKSSSKKVKNPKKRGGDSANNNAIDMGNISRTDFLPLENYKEYQPFNLQAQLFL